MGETETWVSSSESETHKRRRRGTSFLCKHGCGFIYKRGPFETFDRKKRDAFDYHEKAACENLPKHICLACSTDCNLKLMKGPASLSRHLKSSRHKRKVQELHKNSSDTSKIIVPYNQEATLKLLATDSKSPKAKKSSSPMSAGASPQTPAPAP